MSDFDASPSAATEAPAPPPLPPLPPLPVRLVQVVFSPAALFDRLKDRPVWVSALLLGAVMVAIGVVAIPADVWGEMVRSQLLEAGQEVPPNLATSGNLFRIFGAAGSAIFWLVLTFALAGVVTVIFAFVLADRLTYRQALSGTAHSLLIAAMGALLVLPLKIIQRDPQLTLSVGTFVPGLDGYVGAFLNGLDLFGLWAYFLIGFAISRFEPRRSVAAAAGVLVTIFVAFVAVMAIFQA